MKVFYTFVVLLAIGCGLRTTVWASCLTVGNVVTDAASNSVMVSFAPSTGIGQYVVLLQQGSSQPYRRYSTSRAITFMGPPESTGRAVMFSWLPENTTFQVRVGSVCGPGDTTYTAPSAVTTRAFNYLCPTTIHMTVGSITSTQVTFDAAVVYRTSTWYLNYWPAGNSSNPQWVAINYPVPVVLSNLLPNTRYEARYTYACVGAGTSGGSALMPFKTLATDCNPITNVAVVGSSATTASVRFTAGAGNTSFVVACYSPADATRRYVNGTGSPIELTGLVAGQTYYVQVQSTCASGGDAYFNDGAFLPVAFQGAGPLANSSTQPATGLLVYPSPAHHTTSVLLPRLPGQHTARLILFSSLGQPVLTREVALPATGGTTDLALTDLTPGLYVLRMEAENQTATCRLVIE